MNVVFAGLHRSGRLDLEAIETATRAAMHRAGAGVLHHLLQESAPVPARVACECGESARYREKRSRNLLTAVGPVRFERAYYCCAGCHRGQSPRDRELDVLETDYSPGVSLGRHNVFYGLVKSKPLGIACTSIYLKSINR